VTGRRSLTPPLFAPNGARLDPVDLELIRRLQEDAHIQNQALARALGLSPSGCLKRVRRLEEGGAIKGYVALAEETMFDGWSMLWVSIKLRRRAHKRREAFAAALRETPEVIEAHGVAGRFDYILKVALPSVSAWDALRERLDSENGFIKSVDVAPGLRTAKEKSPHPLLSVREQS
jgi:DNA-binding Lrp family transcriptional regulator